MWMYEILEIIAVGGMIGVILLLSIGLPLRYYLHKKRIEEEHKTSNLALAYQILSVRPEATIDDVKQLIELSGNQNQLPTGYLQDRSK